MSVGIYTVQVFLNADETGENFENKLEEALLGSDLRNMIDYYSVISGK